MGIWERIKAAFTSCQSTECQTGSGATASSGTSAIRTVRPSGRPEVDERPRTESLRQAETAKFYEAEKRRGQAAGQTVKGYRAGYISAEEAKSRLIAGPGGLPLLKLVPSNNGLDLAISTFLPFASSAWATTSARSRFCSSPAPRREGRDPEKPFKFRNGQRVAVKRESDNEHDANAVAIMAGRPGRKIGYVNKQRAKMGC